jgi:hypothetical protein
MNFMFVVPPSGGKQNRCLQIPLKSGTTNAFIRQPCLLSSASLDETGVKNMKLRISRK